MILYLLSPYFLSWTVFEKPAPIFKKIHVWHSQKTTKALNNPLFPFRDLVLCVFLNFFFCVHFYLTNKKKALYGLCKFMVEVFFLSHFPFSLRSVFHIQTLKTPFVFEVSSVCFVSFSWTQQKILFSEIKPSKANISDSKLSTVNLRFLVKIQWCEVSWILIILDF